MNFVPQPDFRQQFAGGVGGHLFHVIGLAFAENHGAGIVERHPQVSDLRANPVRNVPLKLFMCDSWGHIQRSRDGRVGVVWGGKALRVPNGGAYC